MIEKIGIDKFAHLGIGGLICALISNVLILQEPTLSWKLLLYSLIGSGFVFIISVFKEYFIDSKPDWADIMYAMIGCLLYIVSLAFGLFLHFI